MSEGYRSTLVMVAHLKVSHGWTWVKLKRVFPGWGRHFWEEVRWLVEDMTDDG